MFTGNLFLVWRSSRVKETKSFTYIVKFFWNVMKSWVLIKLLCSINFAICSTILICTYSNSCVVNIGPAESYRKLLIFIYILRSH